MDPHARVVEAREVGKRLVALVRYEHRGPLLHERVATQVDAGGDAYERRHLGESGLRLALDVGEPDEDLERIAEVRLATLTTRRRDRSPRRGGGVPSSQDRQTDVVERSPSFHVALGCARAESRR